MNIELKPELWNCLSAVQKRVVAESIDVKSMPRHVDVSELAAWVLTLAAAGVVFGFASLLMHLS